MQAVTQVFPRELYRTHITAYDRDPVRLARAFALGCALFAGPLFRRTLLRSSFLRGPLFSSCLVIALGFLSRRGRGFAFVRRRHVFASAPSLRQAYCNRLFTALFLA